MFAIWLFFILAIALPFGFRLAALPHDVVDRVVLGLVAVGLLVLAVWLIGRLLAARSGRTRVRTPDPATVGQLAWPRHLTRAEFESYCTAYLSGEGWSVAQVLSDVTDGTFLRAERASVQALLLCDVAGESLRPAALRALALVAGGFAGARAAILTQQTQDFTIPVANVARDTSVTLLHVADLPRLAEMVARSEARVSASAD